MLQFITSYFNFTNSNKIKQNYINFRKKFPYDIITIEVALPNQKFFIDDSIKIKCSNNQILWQKERCLNIALENLSPTTDSVSWIDADIILHNDNFLNDANDTLSNYKVAQIFERVFELPNVNSTHNTISFAKDYIEGHHLDYAAVGFGWAMRREVLEYGFYDSDILGNSDCLQLISWLGLWNHRLVKQLTPKHRLHYLLWAIKSFNLVNSNIGCIKGDIEHMYHGSMINRAYVARSQILTDNNFDPGIDIKIDDNKLYVLSDSKPILQNQILNYFMDRKDDE